MSEFFTGQLNLNQLKIIEYNSRPFSSTDDMNNAFIDNINVKVKPADKLYIVGNFLFGSLDDEKFIRTAKYFRRKINCNNLFLIYGNHDRRMKKNERFTSLFNHCTDYMEIKTECETSIILFHYPMFNWNRQKSGAIHLYSGQLSDTGIDNSLNVGIDNWRKFFNNNKEEKDLYTPFSVGEIKSALNIRRKATTLQYTT